MLVVESTAAVPTIIPLGTTADGGLVLDERDVPPTFRKGTNVDDDDDTVSSLQRRFVVGVGSMGVVEHWRVTFIMDGSFFRSREYPTQYVGGPVLVEMYTDVRYQMRSTKMWNRCVFVRVCLQFVFLSTFTLVRCCCCCTTSMISVPSKQMVGPFVVDFENAPGVPVRAFFIP